MSKMNIAPSERPRVKAECLRLLLTLQLNPARMQLISGFVGAYLDLNAQEEQVFETAIDRMGLNDEQQEEYMEMLTSWEREGAYKERRESISGFLRAKFGNIDAQLEAIIPQLMQLSPQEYTDLLVRVSREELISRFERKS